MRKLVALATLAALLTGIGDAGPPHIAAPIATPRPAQQEDQVTPMKKVGLLSLTYRRRLDLAPRLARSIERISIIQGVALLKDGRCFRLRQALAEGGSDNAAVEAAPAECQQLATSPLVSARCGVDRANATIGNWRVGCRTIGKRRSLILATRTDDPLSMLELASLSGEELIAVGVIGLHDQGVVMTVGIRPGRTVALSHYLWFDGPYRKLPPKG